MKNINELMSRVLDPEDYVQYGNIKKFLDKVPPAAQDAARGAYVADCLRLQDWANVARGHLLYELIHKRSYLLSQESAWREEFRDEKIRSADERTAALYGNPRYRVLREEVDELQLAADRLSAVEWILKGAVK